MLDSIALALPSYVDTAKFKDASDIQKFDAILTEILNMKHKLNQSQNDRQSLSQHQQTQSEVVETGNQLKDLEEACDSEGAESTQSFNHHKADSVTSAKISIQILITKIQGSLANYLLALQSTIAPDAFIESERFAVNQSEESFMNIFVDEWYSSINTQLDRIQQTLFQVNYLASKASSRAFPTSTQDITVIPDVLSNDKNDDAKSEDTLNQACHRNFSRSNFTEVIELENQLLLLSQELQRANDLNEKLESSLLMNKLKADQRAECAARNLQLKTDELEGQIHFLQELNSRNELIISKLMSRLCVFESLPSQFYTTFDFEAMDGKIPSDETVSVTNSSILFNVHEALQQQDNDWSQIVDSSQLISQIDVESIDCDATKLLIQRLETNLYASTKECAFWKRLSSAAPSTMTLYVQDAVQTELSKASELNPFEVSAECNEMTQSCSELQIFAAQAQEPLSNPSLVNLGDLERPDDQAAAPHDAELHKVFARIEASRASAKQGTKLRFDDLEKDFPSDSPHTSINSSTSQKLVDPFSSNVISAFFRRYSGFSAEYFAVQAGLHKRYFILCVLFLGAWCKI
jgi:hypothetical protein